MVLLQNHERYIIMGGDAENIFVTVGDVQAKAIKLLLQLDQYSIAYC